MKENKQKTQGIFKKTIKQKLGDLSALAVHFS